MLYQKSHLQAHPAEPIVETHPLGTITRCAKCGQLLAIQVNWAGGPDDKIPPNLIKWLLGVLCAERTKGGYE
jgi:hypothetical protein